jgi:hypothetical protein
MARPDPQALAQDDAVTKDSYLAKVLRMLLDGEITIGDLPRFCCFAESATAAMLLARLYWWEVTPDEAVRELYREGYLSPLQLTELLSCLPLTVQEDIEDLFVQASQGTS